MSYNPNIPQPTDDPTASQPQILQNFGTIMTAFNLNHTDIDSGATAGQHKFVQMPEQGSDPTIGATEGVLYTKDVGGDPELFWISGLGSAQQITNQQSWTGAQGSITLAGGLTFKWGNTTLPGTSVTVNFTSSFSTIYTALATAQASSFRELRISSKTSSSLTFGTNSGSSFTVNWWAIGV